MKKLLLLFIPLVFFFSCSIIKKNKSVNTVLNENWNGVPLNTVLNENWNEVATDTIPPIYPGCSKNLTIKEHKKCFQKGVMEHVKNNFYYPLYSKKKGIYGRVLVNITIDVNGRVSEARVVHFDSKKIPGHLILSSEREKAEKEIKTHALILMKSLPKMGPAIANKKAISCSFTIPINYSLH